MVYRGWIGRVELGGEQGGACVRAVRAYGCGWLQLVRTHSYDGFAHSLVSVGKQLLLLVHRGERDLKERDLT